MASDQTYILPPAPFKTENSDRITVTDKQAQKIIEMRGLRADLIALAPRVGTITSDGYKVISLDLTPGPVPILTITLEPVAATDFPGQNGGNAFPADTWELTPQYQDTPLERGAVWGSLTSVQKALWKKAFQSSQEDERADAIKYIETNYPNPHPDDIYPPAPTVFRQLYDLKKFNHDTFPLCYWEYKWVQHDSMVPALSDGNIVETPTGPGAAYLGNDLTWLRRADQISGEEGHYVIVRSWLGARSSLIEFSSILLRS